MCLDQASLQVIKDQTLSPPTLYTQYIWEMILEAPRRGKITSWHVSYFSWTSQELFSIAYLVLVLRNGFPPPKDYLWLRLVKTN